MKKVVIQLNINDVTSSMKKLTYELDERAMLGFAEEFDKLEEDLVYGFRAILQRARKLGYFKCSRCG